MAARDTEMLPDHVLGDGNRVEDSKTAYTIDPFGNNVQVAGLDEA